MGLSLFTQKNKIKKIGKIEPKTQPMLFTIQPNHLGMHGTIVIYLFDISLMWSLNCLS